jgi:hypothetical protein
MEDTMTKKLLNEGFRAGDLKRQIYPIVGIDRYASNIGPDDASITLDFSVKSKEAALDLAGWFERGYECVMDASTSPGEVTKDKFLVFVEIKRRSNSPENIIEMISDLEPLTELNLRDWEIRLDDEVIENTAEYIRARVELSPKKYREAYPNDPNAQLNEWREIAGVAMTTTQCNDSPDIKALKRQAGLL